MGVSFFARISLRSKLDAGANEVKGGCQVLLKLPVLSIATIEPTVRFAEVVLNPPTVSDCRLKGGPSGDTVVESMLVPIN